MKKIYILLVLVAFALPSYAEMTGREIYQKMDDVDTSRDSSMDMLMLIERGNMKLVRRIDSVSKKYGDDTRTLITFEEPADVQGTMYLTWGYEDTEKDDDMWMFLPSENLTRRISGGGKKGSFMRSDFANEDIEKRAVDDDAHTLLKKEKFGGYDCYVLETVPMKKKETNYGKRRVWVHDSFFLPVKTEYFDKRGRLIKTALYGGFKNISGIMTYTKTVMRTEGTDNKTYLERTNVVYNTGVSDDVFQLSNLKR